MAYATVEELAAALNIRPLDTNREKLQRCLDAAAEEIDHANARYEDEPIEEETNAWALARSVNLLRGVQWWKANDAAFGQIGFDQTGALRVPADGFDGHAITLTPLKHGWGIA